MPDEIPASARTSPEDGLQGQKMTIYMPQGAVIIERTEAEEHTEPQSTVIPEKQHALPITVNEQPQSAGAVVNIYTNDQSRGVNEQPQSAGGPTARTNADEQQVLFRIAKILDGITERTIANEEPQPAVICQVCVAHQQHVNEQPQSAGAVIPERTNADEHQILFRIAEILDVITDRMVVSEHVQPVGVTTESRGVSEHVQPVGVTTESRGVSEHVQPVGVTTESRGVSEHVQPVGVTTESRGIDNVIHVNGRHLDWLHIINIAFVAFVAFVALVPAALSTFFGIVIYASSSNSMNTPIYQGDMMISKLTPASKLNLGDVLLLRNEHTWDLEVRQVTVASTSSGGDLTTIATETEAGAASSDSYILKSATLIHKVTSIIPKFGDVTILLTSIFIKIGVGFFLLALNIFVQIRRAQKRRADRK